MLLDESADNLDLALVGAESVYALQQPTTAIALQAVLNRVKTGMSNVGAYPYNDDNLGWGFVRWQGYLVVVFQGVRTFNHGHRYIQALDYETNWNLAGGCNEYVLRQAERVRLSLSAQNMLPANRVVVFGHSMGGAAGQAFVHELRSQGLAGSITLITYGSPRPGPDTFAALMQPVDLVRWMTSEDAVPLIPPRQNQAPTWFMAVSERSRLNANRYVQPKGGIVIEQDGRAFDRDVPETSLQDVQGAIAGWLLSVALQQQSIHSIPAYINAFRRRLERPSA